MQQGLSVVGAAGGRQLGGRPEGGGGWRAKLSAAQAWAAADIGHAVEHQGCASAIGMRVMDITRMVVDGGPLPSSMPGGGWAGRAEKTRWDRYRQEVRRRDPKRAAVRGRRKTLFVDLLLVRVVIDGVSETALDEELGVRKGRCGQAVLSELTAYAAAYGDARWWTEKRLWG
jgi:hypothetical protein